MANCIHYRNAHYFRREPCLAGHDNIGGLDLFPCLFVMAPDGCPDYLPRDCDEPTEWQPAAGPSHAEVIRRSQRNFSDNPNKE